VDRKRPLSEAIDRYIDEVNPVRSTVHQLEWWRAHYGRVQIGQFRKKTISEAKARLKKDKNSNGTRNRYLAAISHLLTVAA
jgi:hypothetical protein